MKQALILAGGKGTRLKDRLGDLPKPLIRVGGKPLLEHQVALAWHHGFTDILVFACYRADAIQEALGDGARWGVRIRHELEAEPRGTAGAVLAAYDRLADTLLVLYGDTMVNVDLSRLWQAHQANGAEATLFLHPNDHPLDSDLVEVDATGRISAFHNRPHPPGQWRQNLVNAGLYVVNRRALEPWVATADRSPPCAGATGVKPGSRLLDFGRDVFPGMLAAGVHLHGYASPEYIKDIGTPERYDSVCAEYDAGVVHRSSLEVPQVAVFLDRDGTLVSEVSRQGVCSPDQLELLPGVAEAIRSLNRAGVRAVVITNQPVVAKGFCSEPELQVIHNKLETLLGRDHAFLDRIYYCPHHPEKGFLGERPELKVDCGCRKPRTGLIEQAIGELNIAREESWLIGDSTTDLQTARNAGLRSVLVGTGYGGKDGRHSATPDHACATLLEAVRHVLQHSTR